MQNINNNEEEEIIEDIQIEEDEFEEENNKNSTTNKNTYDENTETDLMYEDEYESVKDEILKSMSLLSSHKESMTIKNLQQKNKNKLKQIEFIAFTKIFKYFVFNYFLPYKKNL